MQDNATLSLSTSITYKAAAHTSLTILLHVMYGMSSYGTPNCNTHGFVINIDYLNFIGLKKKSQWVNSN